MTIRHDLEIQSILARPYARRLLPDEEGGYTARIAEFPGCVAEGENAEEALRNLDRAAASWLDASLVLGYAIAEPLPADGVEAMPELRRGS
jgi:predicted RNase H-like HicB family nuclease